VHFVDRIFSLVWDIYEFFIELSYEAQDIWVVGPAISGWFYSVARACFSLLTPIAHFRDWTVSIELQLIDMITWESIQGMLSEVWNLLEPIQDWLDNVWTNVYQIVNTWWTDKVLEVQALIDLAIEAVVSAVNNLSTAVNNLSIAWAAFKGKIPTLDEVIAWWSNWPGELLSVINSWWTGKVLEVQALINTAFVTRQSFWAGWQELRDQVLEFFSDPEDWVYKRLDSFFERFW